MAGRQVLIDGYNVIRADPTLAGVEALSLADARELLTRSVASWPRFLGDSVTIVFDGPGTRSFATRQQHNHVSVTFPPAGHTADDVIKSLAGRARDKSQVVVVTNDADIREFCQALGCTVTGSENLLSQLGDPRGRAEPNPRTVTKVSLPEVPAKREIPGDYQNAFAVDMTCGFDSKMQRIANSEQPTVNSQQPTAIS